MSNSDRTDSATSFLSFMAAHPEAWQRRLFYTEGYEAYAAFLGGWRHRVWQKGDCGACTVEACQILLGSLGELWVSATEGERSEIAALTVERVTVQSSEKVWAQYYMEPQEQSAKENRPVNILKMRNSRGGVREISEFKGGL